MNHTQKHKKHLASCLEYKSSSMYFYMRDTLNLQLPVKSSIHRWAPIKKLHFGFNQSLLREIKVKFDRSENNLEKEAVLLFDEIKINIIDGFVDYGNSRQFKIGGSICCFMIRGLFSNWKYVISYFVVETKRFTHFMMFLTLSNR